MQSVSVDHDRVPQPEGPGRERVALIEMTVPAGCTARVVGVEPAKSTGAHRWVDRTVVPAHLVVEVTGLFTQEGDIEDDPEDDNCVRWTEAAVQRFASMGIDITGEDPARYWMEPVSPLVVQQLIPIEGSEAPIQRQIDAARVLRQRRAH